jgi:uncharacterized protein
VKRTVLTLLLGITFGVALSRIGFTSWDEVHRMFTFADLRLLLTFVVAVSVLAAAYPLLHGRWPSHVPVTSRPIHKGTVLGGVLFGVGWALSGSCPSIALVQLGEGQLGALVTLAGIVAGNYAYAVVREKYLLWDTKSCIDD